jgi:chromosome segregation ATPase
LRVTTDANKRALDKNETLERELRKAQERRTIAMKLMKGQMEKLERKQETWDGEKGILETGLECTKAREEAAKRSLDVAKSDLDIKIAEVDRLTVSNQDLLRRLDAGEQAQLEADTSRQAVEDRCRALKDELSGAVTLLEGSKSKAEEADQAFSEALSEVSSLQQQLGDQLKTMTVTTTLMEQQKHELEAKLEYEHNKSTELQMQQDRLTKEVADSCTKVQRLESALEEALVWATAFEKENTDLSSDLDRSQACAQHLRKVLDEHAVATELLNDDCKRLLQQIGVLKEKASTDDDKMTSLRGKLQELESALDNSQAQATTSEREKTELTGELDSARERNGALDKALTLHDEEMAALKTDHSKISQQLELLRDELKSAEVRTNTLPSPSNSTLLDPKREATPDKANESMSDTTASCIGLQPQPNDQRRDSADVQRKPSDAVETLTKNATRQRFTALQPEEILHKQSPSPPVIDHCAVAKSSASPLHSQGLTKATPKTKGASKANEGVIQAIVSSPKPDLIAVAAHGEAPDPTPLNKKHARAADCDDLTEPKMSKRARRRKRHRESLEVPGSNPK